ncbi:MAG: biopolymer transporter ExbD [Victivallaceae bacterium]|nr:biopolymer transporter ExbD [Victivallaceae bacterium]
MARRVRTKKSTMDQINVTPLLDLTFMLLIVFMITTPLLEYAIDVTPPELNADKIPEDNTVTIALNKRGEYTYDKKVVTPEELLANLQKLRINSPKAIVLVSADGTRSYNDVIELMKTARNAGFANVSLITTGELND